METTWRTESITPRARVISDNDYCGDPDGLVQLAHHLLCIGISIPFVVGSAVATHHPSCSGTCAADSVTAARRVAKLAGHEDVPILAGSSTPMSSTGEPAPSPAAEAVVAEAMRDDTDLPGASCGIFLTEVATGGSPPRSSRSREPDVVAYLG